ncbi:MAG: SusC/RagA family TonB-linked outer membrane protein [Bacteroidales bacterium]|nr:SusC/RagA family TonB-linked outer membrane protein [Bacteroidales bacterium]
MHKFLLFLIIVTCFPVILLAQQQTISGTVTSSEDGLGIPGVSILIKGTTQGTVTDVDGNFTLKSVSPSDTLQFSFLGFDTKEMMAGANKTISVSLKPSAKEIEGVVVTALGVKREKREIGYTMESFKGEDLRISNTSNAIESLSGRSAGVNVTTVNGVEGGTTRITIRGNNNIADDNQPLIVVDGVPMENEPGLTNIGRGVDWGSTINNINQEDIESMNILKGPTASALYGSRGANGVLLITTKRGEKKKGLGVKYSYSYKITNPYKYRDVQNKYGAGGPLTLTEPTYDEVEVDGELVQQYPEFYHSDNGPYGMSTQELFGYYGTAVSWGPEMLGQKTLWWDGKIRNYSPQPDNLKLFFSNGNTQTHNLSFSGASDMGSIRISMTRTDVKAIVANSNFDQTTINMGSRINVSEKVHADLAFSYINFNRNNSPVLGEDQNSFSKGLLYCYPRSWKGIELDAYELRDGTRNEWGGNYPFDYISPYVVWEQYHNSTIFSRDKLIGAFTLTYDVTPWLNVLGRLGLDFNLNQFETRNDPTDDLGLLNGFYQNELGRDIVNNNDFLITFHKEELFHSKFNGKVSFGGTQWQRRQYGVRGKSGTEWTNPWLFSMINYGNANDIVYDWDINDPSTWREYRYEKSINSLYTFINLGYDDFIFMELTGRNDWSSTLPSYSNSYFYPSVSLSFIPTEAFDFGIGWFNFWKVRGAVAGTATDTEPYQLSSVYYLGTFANQHTSYLSNKIPPLELQPQFANSYELGTTVGLFDNRLNFDFTYYYIKSDNQILDSPIPVSSGASEIRINNGVLENKGWELILSGVALNQNNWVVETGLNISRNRNFVVSLGDGAKTLLLGDIWGLNGPAIVVREGDEYGTIVGYDYVYHENGQPILNDAGTHYQYTDTRVPIGNSSPDFIGGWWTQVRYKSFTLRTLIDTKWGGDIYCGSYVTGLQTGQSPETLIERDGGGLPYTDPDGITRNVGVILPGVYADGSPNDKVVHYYHKYLPNAGGWGHFISTPGIVENTWVKFREISLVYRVPQKLVQKTKVFQDFTISVVGRDLFYLYTTIPDNINPEGLNGAGNAQGLEWASMPGTRSFTFSVSASF